MRRAFQVGARALVTVSLALSAVACTCNPPPPPPAPPPPPPPPPPDGMGKGSGVQNFADLRTDKIIVIRDVLSGTERRLTIEL
jgi:hypothetical protein